VNVAAIIPARGGSKTLPRKNLVLVDGKPLLYYSVEAAQRAQLVDRVVVSSEDEEILEYAASLAAETVRRPEFLATDDAPAEPVVKHAVEVLEARGYQADLVVYLQPTDLFRYKGLIDEAVAILRDHPELESAFTAYPTHKKYWRKEEGGYRRMSSPEYVPRQKGRWTLREDAGLVCVSRRHVVDSGYRIGEKIYIIENDDENTSIDIHTEEDRWLAEQVLIRDRQRPGGREERYYH